MGMVVVLKAVRADHGDRRAHAAAHVRFVHLEIDGACRLEPGGRGKEIGAPLGGDVGKIATGHLGMRATTKS